MRKTVFLVLISAMVMTMSLSVLAQKPTKATFEGELVDSACYVTMDAKGPKHQKCAQQCMTKGFPAGLLTADGKFHTLLVPAGTLAEYAGLQARLTGSLDPKTNTIDVTKLEAQKNGQWVTVKLPEMPM